MLLPRALDICTAGSEIPLPAELVALEAKPKLAALDVKKDGKKEPPMARARSHAEAIVGSETDPRDRSTVA